MACQLTIGANGKVLILISIDLMVEKERVVGGRKLGSRLSGTFRRGGLTYQEGRSNRFRQQQSWGQVCIRQPIDSRWGSRVCVERS